jgi:hypothetical protein
MDCFLLPPAFDKEDRYPLDYRTIRHYQAQDQMNVFLCDSFGVKPTRLFHNLVCITNIACIEGLVNAGLSSYVSGNGRRVEKSRSTK